MRLLFTVFASTILLLLFPNLSQGQATSRDIGSEIEHLVTVVHHLEEPMDQASKLEVLDAAYEKGAIVLEWVTTAERNNARFEVERSVRTYAGGMQPWTTLTYVAGQGTSDSLTTYAYYDKGDIAGVSQVLYRLKQVNFDGSSRVSEVMEATLPAPKAFAVSSYPNPYTFSATIEYDIPSAGRVKLTVYDAEGRQTETLVNRRKSAGRYRVIFDASNQGPGLYMYRLEAGGRVWVDPFLLVQQ